MGTHPIFESDFDCLTEREKLKMESEAWRSLKQEAIKFELKTGLNVNIIANRGEKLVYEYSSTSRNLSETGYLNRRVHSESEQKGTKTQISSMQNRPNDVNSNRKDEEDIDFDYESENEVELDEDIEYDDEQKTEPQSEALSAISIKPRERNRAYVPEIASSAPISIIKTPRASYHPQEEERISESYFGSKLHSRHLKEAAQY